MQSITSVAGTYTGGTDRVSDWTRYGKKRHTSTPAIITLSVTVVLGALVGIIATSAFAEVYGELQWNPMLMLQWIQAHHYNPACRAGTFFAGIGLLCMTVFVNYTQNCVSILGVLANPWRYLSQAETFITVLSSFGVFLSPGAAILVVDFWIIR